MRILTAATVLVGLLLAAMAAYALYLTLPLHPVHCYGEWDVQTFLCVGNGQATAVFGAQ